MPQDLAGPSSADPIRRRHQALLRGVESVSLRSSRLRRSAAIAGAVLLLLLPARLPASARPAPDGFADIAEKLLPSVVNISTTQTVKSDKPEKQGERSTPGRPQFPPGSPFEEFF